MKEILEELQKQFPANIRIESRFEKGACQEELDVFAERIDLVLPKAFCELYSQYNGEKQYLGVFMEFSMMSLEKILTEMPFLKKLPGNVPCTRKGLVREDGYKRGWIPFADDADGSFFIVDMNPDEEGTVGQIIVFDCREWKTFYLADSMETFLKQIKDKIKKGEIAMTPQGVVSWSYGYQFDAWLQ